jgi:hypothetical protein
MKPVERQELLGLGEYEAVREHFRRRIIQVKSARRVALGSNMTLLFENHDTVLFQIQEMLRTERITKEAAIRHEIDTYNALIPSPNELSATLFIEYPDREERERMLSALAGVEAAFYLAAGGARVPARGEHRGERTDRTTAVQYLRFPLEAAAVRVLETGEGELRVGVDHPAYGAEALLSAEALASLRDDRA